MSVDADGVPLSAEFVDLPPVLLKPPVGPAVGTFDLVIDPEEPAEVNGRLRGLHESLAEALHFRQHRLEPRPPRAGSRMDQPLIGLDIDAEDKRRAILHKWPP